MGKVIGKVRRKGRGGGEGQKAEGVVEEGRGGWRRKDERTRRGGEVLEDKA